VSSVVPREEAHPSRNRSSTAVGEDAAWAIGVQEKGLEQVSDWIRAADGKIGTLLAMDAAMVGTLIAIAGRPGGWTQWTGYWIALGSTALLSSLLMVAFATFPQLSGRAKSLIFFGDVASLTLSDYATRIANRTRRKYLDDLTGQCHRNSEIAVRKYLWIRRATLALLIGVIPWLVALFLVVGG
jgi:hypothetical protein